MHRNIILLARALTIAALVMSLGGCGKRKYDVTGKVTYNGAVLAKPDGQIVFVGPDGSQVVSPIAQDGTYTAAKVTAGPNRVAVYYTNPAFKGSKPSHPKRGEKPANPPTPPPAFLTPDSYASQETSTLTVEVKQGTVFDVGMTGPEIP